jgi:general stress protein 26
MYKIVMAVLVLFVLTSCSREAEQKERILSSEDVALAIIKGSGTCTLITLDSAGTPRARIMDPFPPQQHFVLWFGTNAQSRKVVEIENDARCTVNYYDKEAAGYVSLYGKAEIIRDPVLLKEYWKSAWQAFYPDYPQGYCLIKFTPDYLELISEKHGITGNPVTWKPARIRL